MKKLLFSACLLFSLTMTSSAQIGVTAGYANADVKEWERAFQLEVEDNRQLFINGTRLGLNYWFRLKNVRIEFLPSVEYTTYATWTEPAADRSEFDLSGLGGFLHTRFYLFDFANDCDCPTFSKQNKVFKKGFFVALSPGVERFSSSVTIKEDDNIDISEQSEWKLSGGLSVGLDLGFSDLITVTPIIGVTYASQVEGKHLFNNGVVGSSTTDVLQKYAALNISFRFNQ